MMTKTLKRIGDSPIEVPAKRAEDFLPGNVIALNYGYTLKVMTVMIVKKTSTVKMTVEHVPEENEFWDGESTHEVEYPIGEILGIAERHGNEGLC